MVVRNGYSLSHFGRPAGPSCLGGKHRVGGVHASALAVTLAVALAVPFAGRVCRCWDAYRRGLVARG